MTLFVMDETVRAQLHALAQYADQNRHPLSFLKERAEQAEHGDNLEPLPDEYSLTMPTGFGVTFTIEQHPSGWMRHMSMSSPNTARVPIPIALEWVMGELGFTRPFEQCVSWPEHVPDGRVAINVLEPIQDNTPTSQAMN